MDAQPSSPDISQIFSKAALTLLLSCSGVSSPPVLSHRSSFSVVLAGMVIPGNNLLIWLSGPLLENPSPHNVFLNSLISATRGLRLRLGEKKTNLRSDYRYLTAYRSPDFNSGLASPSAYT